MHSVAFTLLSEEDPDRVYAFGLEILKPAGDVEEAITFRRNPTSGHTTFGVHASAEAACMRHSIVTPLILVRESNTNTPLPA